MSVGLFGAYAGNPRVQRAYASPACSLVGDALTLQSALDDSTVTCIEITNSFPLTGQLGPIDEQDWVGSAREDDGLTIMGSGDDTIDGAGYFGIQLTLNDPASPLTKPAKLSISDLNFTNFTGNNGTAVYAYLYGQAQDLFLTLDGVNVSSSSSYNVGGAVYANTTSSSTYVEITNSSFMDNSAHIGGALYILADDTAVLDISASTLTNNSAAKDAQSQKGQGGAISMRTRGTSQILVDSATKFEHNQAEDSGGAVLVDASGDVSASISGNAEFVGNTSGGGGGAVNLRSNQGDVDASLTAADFTDNQALWGGAVYTYGYDSALTTINSSTFTRNVVLDPQGGQVDGGAIFTDSVVSASVTIGPDTHFTDNDASGRGGAIHAGWLGGSIGTVTIDEYVSFDGNTAGDKGGAVYARSEVDLLGGSAYPTSFSHNQAAGHGGAIATAGSVQVGPGTELWYNQSGARGGAIYAEGSAHIQGSASHPVSFANNTAQSGGALHTRSGGAIIESALFQDNYANGGDGGAVLNYWPGDLSISTSTFEGNDATGDGGAVWSGGLHTTVSYSSIVGNSAQSKGGGIRGAFSYDLSIDNTFIGGNVADRGGAIYMGEGRTGALDLAFTTVYDDTVTSGGTGPTAIYANNLTSTMSVVGSRTSSDTMSILGSIDDTDSVSTAGGSDAFGHDVAPGSLGFQPLTGSAPGELGSTPSTSSVLSTASNGGFAPLTNPLPSVTRDQLGVLRIAPFTIGARSAVVAAAPSVTSVTPASGSTGGGDVITIHGSGFTGATGASIGGSAVTNLVVVNDTTITGTTPTGSAGAAAVSVTGPGGTGSLPSGFTFVAPTPPAPNPPAPTVPASAPRDVRAQAGVESADVSWLPPSSSGTFPVTSYQAVASPGGQACLVTAPALTCTITGLTAGTPYTVTARALTGAGWGATSSPSETVVPLAPPTPAATILITSSRDRAQKSIARVEGTTTGLVGAEVVPYVRIAGQKAFAPRASTRTVDADGNFVWQRKANKRFTVYFVSGDVTSNRLVIQPE